MTYCLWQRVALSLHTLIIQPNIMIFPWNLQDMLLRFPGDYSNQSGLNLFKRSYFTLQKTVHMTNSHYFSWLLHILITFISSLMHWILICCTSLLFLTSNFAWHLIWLSTYLTLAFFTYNNCLISEIWLN